ncbi:MAG TPA: SpoIID/LytB domain-containing protein [Candidatus Babeliales bacterium]|nr:SpoIID/LytB domain-containing protein [Candidatus Babeliales bacterium]
MHIQTEDDEIPLYCISPKGFTLISSNGIKRRTLDAQILCLSGTDSTLYMYETPLIQDAIWLEAPGSAVTINGIKRNGSLHVSSTDSGLSVSVIGNAERMQKKQMQAWCDACWHISDNCVQLSQRMYDSVQSIEKSIEESALIEDSLFTIRVLLDAYPLSTSHTWNLISASDFFVQDMSKPSRMYCIKKNQLQVIYKKNTFYINDIHMQASAVRVKPVDGHIVIDGNAYEGEFIFTADKKNALCINGIDLESYVCCVLKSESWPGWPLEINKVLAIVIRTYAMAQAMQASKNKRLYHIKNTNAHQTYRGMHTSEIIKKAVQDTRNIVIMYNNEPILAMFDCCCGGIVTKHIEEGIDFDKAPYLARSYACPFCKGCKIYQWQTQYDIEKFLHHLDKNLVSCAHHIHDIKVTKRDKAGLVREVMVTGKTTKKKFSGRQLYSLIPDIKSYHFDIIRKGKNIMIQGNGFGHHLGLCQWGGREMIKRGSTYQQVLSFYYPQTRIVKLV